MNQIEKVARAIWDQQRNHWGHYRDMVPDLCEWEELTQSKQRELMREAKAAIAAMQPAPQEPVDEAAAEITRLTEALRAAEEREKGLRVKWAELHNTCNIAGSPYAEAMQAIDSMVDHVRTVARAALKGPAMTPEQIARGLTKAQREAMLASHWSARQGTGLQKLGLTYWGNGPHGNPILKFSQLGRAVRAELERIADE